MAGAEPHDWGAAEQLWYNPTRGYLHPDLIFLWIGTDGVGNASLRARMQKWDEIFSS
jgi:hypothetical protein